MPSIIKRVWNVLHSKSQDVYSRPEDPEKQFNEFINQLHRQVEALQNAVGAALVDEKRLKVRYDDIMLIAGEWEKKAVLALEKNNEDLAKEAIIKKMEYTEQASSAEKNWETQKSATDRLKVSLGQAKNRLDEIERQYTLLVARHKSAETRIEIAKTLSSFQEGSPLDIMEQITEKTLTLESEAEAALELTGEPGYSDTEQALAETERKKQGEDVLEELKAKIEKTEKPESKEKLK
ncbi:MAG: PspA/IM30 family protein [Desulfobacteraceae bacterium]|nr:PspA/IM30 family protein [Desulfobacteraceae bacterium]